MSEGSSPGRPGRQDIRDHLVVALDMDDLDGAVDLARGLQPWFAVAKVGLELFGSVGPRAVDPLVTLGYRVFLDLKLHDIPTTVGRAARTVGRLGASYVTMHAQGGAAMLRAGVEGLAEGASISGRAPAAALAVTVLTSEQVPADGVVAQRVRAATDTGCGGVVCAAADVGTAKRIAPRLLAVVPGIRPEGTARDDQARAATPRAALSAGADLLVVGRAVTAAADPRGAAEDLVASLGEKNT